MKYERFTDEKFVKAVETCNMACVYGEKCIECVYFSVDNCPESVQRKLKKAIPRLAELEDKIEQGTLIELPCNVGDTVYRITKSYRAAEQVTPYIVKEIIIDKKGVLYLTIALKGAQSITCKVKLETVFLTREEAEKKLKELQNG